jgi:phosphatidylserine/phosphatidylglycerophosphate/cardiolipin synthase-like enzyme
MHSKYAIIDKTYLYSGSFNWSYSSEYNHIENAFSLSGNEHPDALDAYLGNFTELFSRGRRGKTKLLNCFKKTPVKDRVRLCKLFPMTLSFLEIDAVVKAFKIK